MRAYREHTHKVHLKSNTNLICLKMFEGKHPRRVLRRNHELGYAVNREKPGEAATVKGLLRSPGTALRHNS